MPADKVIRTKGTDCGTEISSSLLRDGRSMGAAQADEAAAALTARAETRRVSTLQIGAGGGEAVALPVAGQDRLLGPACVCLTAASGAATWCSVPLNSMHG